MILRQWNVKLFLYLPVLNVSFGGIEVDAYLAHRLATEGHAALNSSKVVETAVERFLASMDWNGCGNYRRECVTHWTKLFATDEVVYTEPIIQNFLSFIDHMSCSADTYVSLGGSNGCADQLTNRVGTQKIGLGTVNKRKGQRVRQH